MPLFLYTLAKKPAELSKGEANSALGKNKSAIYIIF